ncbi:MAG: hypothetical protein ACI4QR_03270 [Eubacteriales bacterium]
MKNGENIIEASASSSGKRKKTRKLLASIGLITILTGIIYLSNLFRRSFQQLFLEGDDDWNIDEDEDA